MIFTQRAKFRLLFSLSIFRLLQKNRGSGDAVEEREIADEPYKYSRIRCPLCKWQPDSASCWCCASGGFPEFYFNACGTVWNTFDTRGKCPGCAHQWRWTTCLACQRDSLHEDWYSKTDRQ